MMSKLFNMFIFLLKHINRKNNNLIEPKSLFVFLHCYSVRGKLSSIVQMSRYMGVLLAYVVGAYIEYIYVPIIFVFIPTIYALIFVFLPNTPQCYLRKNQIQVSISHIKSMCALCNKFLINIFMGNFNRMQRMH